MRAVMITGSFDPVTKGHEDIIRRACSLFEAVRVVVFCNPEKQGMFSVEQRVSFLKELCKKFENVTVDFDYGMVVDYANRHKIALIVRAVRNQEDLVYELQMADFNRKNGGVETLLLAADPALSHVSSSEVRRRLLRGEEVSSLLPTELCSLILPQ